MTDNDYYDPDGRWVGPGPRDEEDEFAPATEHYHLARLDRIANDPDSYGVEYSLATDIAWAVKTIRQQEARIQDLQADHQAKDEAVEELNKRWRATIAVKEARIAELENYILPVPQPPQITSQKGDAK